MDIIEDLPSVGARNRQDVNLMDKLTMGEGMGSDGKRVHLPSQHIKSWQMLTCEGKKMRTLDPATMNDNLLLRLETVVESVFSRVRHVNISSDGSRHGCKDANYLILGGFQEHSERYRAHCGVMASWQNSGN